MVAIPRLSGTFAKLVDKHGFVPGNRGLEFLGLALINFKNVDVLLRVFIVFEAIGSVVQLFELINVRLHGILALTNKPVGHACEGLELAHQVTWLVEEPRVGNEGLNLVAFGLKKLFKPFLGPS